MKKSLVGYTGFVGSNLCEQGDFEGLYNSKNIKESYGTNPDLLVYSGVPAQKFIANQFPQKDFEIIHGAIENIKKINPKKLVLISTIDVYKRPVGVDEDTIIKADDLEPYGRNRLYLEEWAKNNFEDYLIVHLPSLYGKNLKKNFIYDFMHIIPSMIKKGKYIEITKNNRFLDKYYKLADNGYYIYNRNCDKADEEKLKQFFLNLGFSALNFTDSRSSYQFYNLSYLYKHINIALENNIKVLNLAVEPIVVGELYEYLKNEKFKNEILENVPIYDFKTKYYKLFNGNNGYIFEKKFVLEDIKKFVEENQW